MRALLTFWFTILCSGSLLAAPTTEINVECGNVVEGEFTKSIEEHKYRIKMSPGDSLQLAATPVGDYLAIGIFINGPSGMSVLKKRRGSSGTVSVKTKKLSGRGTYNIHIHNTYNRGPGYLGLYTLFVSCVLRDGTVTEAGG